MRWVRLLCSETGKRETNDDFVIIQRYASRRMRIDILLACDGVGSRENRADCARAVGESALHQIQRYLSKRGSRRSLDAKDSRELKKRLERLPLKEAIPNSATTLAVALFDRSRSRSTQSIIVLWAGDSRVHLLDNSGRVQILTKDHHDDEGRLTSYYAGDGRVRGRLEMFHMLVQSPYSMLVTTDGVHDHCGTRELSQFVLYCIDHCIQCDDDFAEELTHFLTNNISDNYSAALLYRPLFAPEVEVLAAALEQ